MSGKVFISYRREESRASARSLYDQLSAHFDRKQILMDIDSIALDSDFVRAIEKTVSECDVLVALIGTHWLTSTDEQDVRRLDNPEDFVRMEIATALRHGIRVIPVLVNGASMPRSGELPDDLKPLVRRNALELSHNRLNADSERLVAALKRVLEKTTAERRERKKKERLDTERQETAARERLEAERRQKDEPDRPVHEQHLTPCGWGAPLSSPATEDRVFISYSHDSAEHARRVRALADQLRDDGIAAWIDQYVQDPGEGWIRWMRTQVKEADRVLLVFTETYLRRFNGDEEEGEGWGATFEGVIVTQMLYESGGRNAKFRPVVFGEEDERFIPLELRRFNRYRVDTPEHYQNLLRWLHQAPAIFAPPVGRKPDLPPEPPHGLFSSKLEEPRASVQDINYGFEKEDSQGLEWRWFIPGCALLLLGVALVIWGFSIRMLTEDQRRLLVWALPLASGFSASAFAGSLSAKARDWIPGILITASGGFAVWFVSFFCLFPENKVIQPPPPNATPTLTPTATSGPTITLKSPPLTPAPLPSPTSSISPPDLAHGEPPSMDLSSSFKPSGDGASSMAFSFDGQFAIVCGRSDGVTVWHRNSQGGLDLVTHLDLPGSTIARFSATGDAFIAGHGVLRMQFPSFATSQLLDPVPDDVDSVAVSPDGTDVAWIRPGSNWPLRIGQLGIINIIDDRKSWRSRADTDKVPSFATIYFLNSTSCFVTTPSLSFFLLDRSTKQIKEVDQQFLFKHS